MEGLRTLVCVHGSGEQRKEGFSRGLHVSPSLNLCLCLFNRDEQR
jgi:hypothetical protein